MDWKNLIQEVEKVVRIAFENDSTGHDYWHLHRVVQNTSMLCDYIPEADHNLCILAAWLHDVGDHKFSDEKDAMETGVSDILSNLDTPKSIVYQVIDLIKQVSYKGAHVETKTTSIEAAIVQDADRLDALGAIGIARTFAYGGAKNRAIYDPSIPPILHDDFASYKGSVAPTINHFYEKLLLLKDRMQTDAGRLEAERRHKFMVTYLSEFYREIGDDNKVNIDG